MTAPLIAKQLTDRQLKSWLALQGMRNLDERIYLARGEHMPISGGGEVALRKTYAGLEVTRGTGVAVTRKVYGSGDMQKAEGLIRPSQEDRGVFIKNYRSQLGLIEGTFPFKASVTYEDLPWWAELFLKGGVVGIVRGVTAYDYTFVPTPSTDDIKSATFEWGDDTQQFQLPFGMVDTLDITGALGSFWEADLGIIGSDLVPQAFSATPADRTIEDIRMTDTKLAIGVAGASPAGYMTGRFIAFKFQGKNHLSRKYFADGAAQTMGNVGRAEREYQLEVTMEGNAATVTERATWTSKTQRVARVTATGTAIAGSTGPISKAADLVIPGAWEGFTVGNRNTNTIFTGMLDSEYDSALAYDLSLVATNSLAALA